MYDLRVVTLPPVDIFTNMAIDEALLLCCNDTITNGTLRVYAANKHSLSIGYFQSIAGLDFDYMKRNDIDYVRRITGGRAVLHGDEMTFSFAADTRSPFYHPSITKITAAFADIIRKFLAKIGIDTDIAPASNIKRGSDSKRFHCFSASTRNELLAGGRKIVGYALKKSKDSFLLQGSIPIKINKEIYLNIMKGYKDMSALDKIACVRDCTGEDIGFEDMRKLFARTFAENGYNIVSGGLSEKELALYDKLAAKKYRSALWNNDPGRYNADG